VAISSYLISSLFLYTSEARKHPQDFVNTNNDSIAYKGKRRVSLVIGNNKYNQASLKNPRNDAEDMKAILKEFGFDVEICLDADLKTMEVAIDKFIAQLGSDAIALFYYAGHGMQMEGENYLIPTDFAATDEPTARQRSYPVSDLSERMAKANKLLNIIILDACRNNPFRSWSRGLDSRRGLAAMYVGSGSFIAYATEPNETAEENWSGRNGLFTKCLLQSLRESQLCLNEVFDNTRACVARLSGGKQIPLATTGVIGKFCFNELEPTITDKISLTPIPPCKGTTPPDSAFFSVYGSYEPSGIMGDIDDIRIKKLERSCQFKYIVTGKGRHEWDYKFVGQELNQSPAQFGGVMYLNPPNNFGNLCGGFDLRGFHRAIKWRARSLGEDVYVEFIIGGVTWAWDERTRIKIMPTYPDSLPRISLGTKRLTSQPQTFEVDLSNLPPSHFARVVNGYSWVISWGSNNINLNDNGTGPERSKTFEIEISNITYER